MNKRLNFLGLILLISVVCNTACKKECSAPDISENIIGKWRLCTVAPGSVDAVYTFTEDGAYVIGLWIFTPDNNSIYSIDGDNFIIRDTVTNIVEDYTITENKCDKIKLTRSTGQTVEYCREEG